MAASLEEIADSFEPKHTHGPANIGKATALEHSGQDISLVALELERIWVYIPEKPTLLDRYNHGR